MEVTVKILNSVTIKRTHIGMSECVTVVVDYGQGQSDVLRIHALCLLFHHCNLNLDIKKTLNRI